MDKKVVVKRKLNVKALVVILLFLYLIIMLIYYILTMPVKNIDIIGNNILNDEDIIASANIKDSSSLFLLNSSLIEKRIKKLPIIAKVEVKKKLNGTLDIYLEEETILFFSKTNNKYVLAGNKEMELNQEIRGIPILVNYTPSDILANLNAKLSATDKDIINLISEIEYSPDIKNGLTIDENRFILRMNDGNRVLINIANFAKLNSYKKLYATINENELGTFYLDGNRSNVLFRTYEADAKSEVGGQNELPEDAVPVD